MGGMGGSCQPVSPVRGVSRYWGLCLMCIVVTEDHLITSDDHLTAEDHLIITENHLIFMEDHLTAKDHLIIAH